MNDKVPEYSEPLTVELIEGIMSELTKQNKLKNKNQFLITGFCIERGLVQLNVIENEMCTNEKCGVCSGFRKALDKEFKKLI